MKRGTRKQRNEAINSGIRNLVDTVYERSMTRDQAVSLLSDFVSDGLSCHGLSDTVTATDLQYAESILPI